MEKIEGETGWMSRLLALRTLVPGIDKVPNRGQKLDHAKPLVGEFILDTRRNLRIRSAHDQPIPLQLANTIIEHFRGQPIKLSLQLAGPVNPAPNRVQDGKRPLALQDIGDPVKSLLA